MVPLMLLMLVTMVMAQDGSFPDDESINVVCDEMDPRPECCENSECQNVCPDAYCSLDFNCVYPDSCETTTPDYTVTYNPGEECLPYDGSMVPDCSFYNEPFYLEHSSSKIPLESYIVSNFLL